MSKMQCAAQKRAIAELTSSTYNPIEFIERPRSAVAQVIEDVRRRMELLDAELEGMDAAFKGIASSVESEKLEGSLQDVKGAADGLGRSMEELMAWMSPDTRWSPDMLDAFRALLYDIDCTTEGGQAEIKGVVKVLELLGLVGCSVSEHDRVA